MRVVGVFARKPKQNTPQGLSVYNAAQLRGALTSLRVYAEMQSTAATKAEAAAVYLAVRISNGENGAVEWGVRRKLAPGQEARVAVNASNSRFLPSRWASNENLSDFAQFEKRLPSLIGLRPPSSLTNQTWALRSSTHALGLDRNNPRSPAFVDL